ncbi:hypothetical protein B0H13DRAFT_2283252 [Mycena leptocephala]|nr:hypothetical protein B0H13DRAFT_2283252 [Mycena leptocephala]
MQFMPQEPVDAIVCMRARRTDVSPCEPAYAFSLVHEERPKPPSWPDFSGFRALLEDSPHIAAYITRLNIGFVSKTPAADIESLRQIFDKLENVHLRIIGGMDLLIRYFPMFCSMLLDFLERQPLRQFYLLFSLFPPPHSITLGYAHVGLDVENLTLGSEQNALNMEELVLDWSTRTIYDLLAKPKFKSSTQALHPSPLRSASTLEHIHLNHRSQTLGNFFIPPLPSLRSVAFSHAFHSPNTPWFSEIISSALGVAPLLANILIAFSAHAAEPLVLVNALATLDAELVAHTAHPAIGGASIQIIWTTSASAKRFAEFSAVVQNGMPNALKEGRLVVQRFLLQRELCQWRYNQLDV